MLLILCLFKTLFKEEAKLVKRKFQDPKFFMKFQTGVSKFQFKVSSSKFPIRDSKLSGHA